MKKNYSILFFALILLNFSLLAQTSDELWSKSTVSAKQATKKIKRDTLPNKFDIYQLNLNLLKNKLNNTPQRKGQSKENGTILTFPNTKGGLEKFYVYEASIMENALQDKYPAIRSYVGKGIDNPNSFIRFSITTLGLNVIILKDSDDVVYIDPYTSDKSSYIVYSKKSLPKQAPFECGTDDLKISSKEPNSDLYTKTQNANDGYLRTYRLAVAATGEYSQWHLKNQGISSNATDQVKKEAVLSAIVATMTIVNAVYERDVALRMLLVANNTDIIFLDPNTDNLTNNDKYKMLDESFGVINSDIGEANYDIGHIFTAANLGGVAYKGSVCHYYKSAGVSSAYNPTGVYFEGVIIHEIGHQFGASHTFNSCSTNSSNYSTAVEPGSGSTIMAYPGVCSSMFDIIPKDIQMKTDLYFHYVSIKEMWAFISSGSAPCASLISSGNSTPSINELSNYIVPISTPFILNAIANDNDGDDLTYTWEQLDASQAIWPLTSNSTEGPAFRSMPPSSLSYRSFPNESTVLSGLLSNFSEVLPSVARTMKFGVTVRDNNILGGQTASKEILLSFDSNSGPFKVTSQSSLISWEVGSSQTITWDVANTNNSPINCTHVNILLSLDGGFTYPIVLASNVLNNGSNEIIIPDVSSGGARIKVESVNNIFYSVNSNYILINPPVDRTFVPDKNFEQALIDLGYDAVLDSYVLKNNIKSIISLDLNDKSISNLKGIEDFDRIEILKLNLNKLTSIDVSKNLNLKSIIVEENHLTSLDFSNNIKLETVRAYRNNIITINVSKNAVLNHLNLDSNKLTDIDVSNNPELLYLIVSSMNDVNYNHLTSLDVSKNLKLIHLSAGNNKITSLDVTNILNLEQLLIAKNKLNSIDVSKNLALRQLDIWYNHISNLDISKNTKLTFIGIGNNEITSVDFTKNINLEQIFMNTYFILPKYSNSKMITSLDVTKNTKLRDLAILNHKLTYLDISKNNNLNYLNAQNNNISCIQVNNSQLSNIPQSWSKDANSNYSLDCSSQVDDDSDGVMNNIDQCPNTPINQIVNIYGCSDNQLLDDDNDNIRNEMDLCPNTPIGQTVNATGCSQSQIDDDGDGVMNNIDTCPNTPTDESVNATGCSQSQIDDDGDGIMNDKDLCPNTPSGTIVNANGCFFLPANNFSIEVISETCVDKNNGKISISAQATHNYVATINGANYNFNNNSLSVSNLAPGTYNVCIKITGVTFEQCFTITIAEGKTVSGKSSETSNKTLIDIVEGTAPYNVFINGINVLHTLSPSFMLDVKHGDLVEVKTAVLCEGVFSKTIDLFEGIIVYPNPTKGVFEITLPFSLKEVYIELFTVGSQLISKGTYQVVNGKVQLNLENKPTGVYVVKIYLDTPVSLTIIKE